MKKNKKLWSFALAGALAVSNLSGVAAVPFTTIVAQAATVTATSVTWDAATKKSALIGNAYTATLVTDAALAGTNIVFTASTVKLKTLADNTTSSLVYTGTQDQSSTNTYTFNTSDFATLMNGSSAGETLTGDATVYVQAWDVTIENSIISDAVLLKGDLTLNLYKDPISDLALAYGDGTTTNVISAEQGMSIVATQSLTIEDSTYDTDASAVVVTEDGLDALKDAIIDGSANFSFASTALADFTATATTGALSSKYDVRTTPISVVAEKTTTSGSDTVTTTPENGTYYLVVANQDLSATVDTTSNFYYATQEIKIVDLETTGLDLGIGLDDNGDLLTIASGEAIKLGTDVQLYAYLKGSAANSEYVQASDSKITWSVSPSSKATVTNGLVHALKTYTGTVTVTAKYTGEKVNGAAVELTKTVEFTNIENDALTITPSSPAAALVGNNVQFAAKLSDTTDVTSDTEWTVKVNEGTEQSPTWKATTAATVDATGAFVATKAGQYQVSSSWTPSNVDAEYATAVIGDVVIVNVTEAMAVSTKNGTLKSTNGEIVADSATAVTTIGAAGNFYPSDSIALTVKANNNNVTSTASYSSNDTAVATVSAGKITAVGEGTAVITIKSGSLTKAVTVTVTNEEEEESFTGVSVVGDYDDTEAATIYVGDEIELGVFTDGVQLDGSFTYTTTSTTYATISGSTVKGVKAGTITITAKGVVNEKNWTGTLELTIKAADTAELYYTDSDGELVEADVDTTYDYKVDDLNVGNSKTFTVKANGSEITGKWTPTGSAIASVTSAGKVTAKAAGDQVLTFTPSNEDIDPITLKVTVNAATAVIVDEDGADLPAATVAVGGTYQLHVLNGLDDITDTATYVSANDEYVTVSSSGVITGVKKTTQVVTVTVNGIDTISITVTDELATEAISLNKNSVALNLGGDAFTLIATVKPEGTSDELVWASSDTAGKYVALVDNGDGTATITPISATDGAVVITATSGEFEAECNVTVTETAEQAAAAQAALDAADKAIAAAKAAEANPTAETVKAAQDAAAAATAAAKAATEAGETEAAKTAEAAAKTATDAATAAQAKVDEAAKKAEEQKAAEEKAAAAQATGATGTDSASGNAYKVTDGSSKTVAITKASSKASGKVTIPSTVTISGDKFTVTEISANAFKGNKKIKQVVIPKTVTKIGKNAFKNCSKVTKITIKATKNLTVGKNAFKGLKDGSKIVVKGVSGTAKKKLVKKIKKQVTSSRTTVK